MRALVAITVLAVLVGCATSGRKVTQSQLDQVIGGQTTRSELIALFGPPTSEVYSSDGTQVLGWGYAHIGFMGIGTEVQGVSMTIGPDGRVAGYSRTGSPPHRARAEHLPPATQPIQAAGQPLTEQAYKADQLDQLRRQNLSYEEYQKRYREIMGE